MKPSNENKDVERSPVTKEEIMGKLDSVDDPEIALSVVELGLVYDIAILDNRIVNIIMTLTFPGCPYGPTMIADVERAIKSIDGIEKVDVELVWEPPWDPATMASDYAKDVLGIW